MSQLEKNELERPRETPEGLPLENGKKEVEVLTNIAIDYWNSFQMIHVTDAGDLNAIAYAALQSQYDLHSRTRLGASLTHRFITLENVKYFTREGQTLLTICQEYTAEDLASIFVNEKYFKYFSNYPKNEATQGEAKSNHLDVGWGEIALKRKFRTNSNGGFKNVSRSYYKITRKNFLIDFAKKHLTDERKSLVFVSLFTRHGGDEDSVELINSIPSDSKAIRIETEDKKIEQELTANFNYILSKFNEREIALLVSHVLEISDRDLPNYLSNERRENSDAGIFFEGRDTFVVDRSAIENDEKRTFEALRKSRQRVLQKLRSYFEEETNLKESLIDYVNDK